MALTEGNGMSASDIALLTGNRGNDFGFGGNGAWWIIILLLFAAMGGGWGNNFGGGNGMLPFMIGQQNGNQDVQRVVDQQSVMNGISTLAASQAQGFANAEVSRCNAQTNILQTLSSNQMGVMQGFNQTQAAMNQGFNNMQSSFQNCCCENRLAVANLGADIAREAAAGRAQTQASTQQVMDKLCQLELDGVKQNYENRIYGMQNTIDQLRSQLNEGNRLASQTAQTAQILADNAAQTSALENYLNPPARPAYIVQNPNCCGQMWNNCGCGNVA